MSEPLDLDAAERDYAFGLGEFFAQEWGEQLIEEVKRLRSVLPTPEEAQFFLNTTSFPFGTDGGYTYAKFRLLASQPVNEETK